MKRYAVVNSAGELANLAGKDGKPGPAAVRKLNAYGRRQIRRHHPELSVVLYEHYRRAQDAAASLDAAPDRDKRRELRAARETLEAAGVPVDDPRYKHPVAAVAALAAGAVARITAGQESEAAKAAENGTG